MTLKKDSYEKIFFTVMLSGFVLWAVLLFLNPSGVQGNVFFARCQDFFADFFNVLRYIDGRNPYFTAVGTPDQHAYLPICYLILYPFTVFNDYTNLSLKECWASVPSMMSVIVYTNVCCFLVFHSLVLLAKKYSEVNDGNVAGGLVVWAILFSNIFLFSIERGNIILFSSAFINYFLAYYDSENKWLRIFAAFSIALVASIKIYPVFLGLLYFGKKQWKDIAYAFDFGLLLTFLPFFFFERGLGNLPQLFRNVGLQSHSGMYVGGLNFLYGFEGLVNYFFRFMGAGDRFCGIMMVLCKNAIRIVAVCSLSMAVLTRDKFLKLALLVFSIIFFPSNSGFYCGLYLFPLVLCFFTTLEDRGGRLNTALLFMFILMFIPMQWGFTYKIYFNMNYETSNLVAFVMWIFLLIVAIRQFLESIKMPGSSRD